ncbi:MAG: hypothetical protein CVV25_07920 [Ignavibacteriae bacterium HGW-Ignavibacteriae-4]|jgi:hypothetical protein|nr:MAG: hypothetical protein CVV25_07920 [Ignavibacteriae bacterium HGW-Ignavibacteriae-4]
MKTTTILLLFLLTTSLAFSQRQEGIDSDRPGQSISPLTVGKNVLQVQTGFNYFDKQYYDVLNLNSYSNATKIRFGFTENFELNSTVGYRINISDFDEPNRPNLVGSGIDKLKLGARLNILNRVGLTPKVAINAELLFTLDNEVIYFPKNGIEIMASIKQPITDKLALTTNVGFLCNTVYPNNYYPYTLNSSYSFSDEIFAFVEIYGHWYSYLSINYNGGIGFNLNNDFLIDISSGLEPSEDHNGWFIDAGVSFRFSVAESKEE